MTTLAVFPNPPPSGEVTLCERNAEFMTTPASNVANQVIYYPDLNPIGDLRKATRSTISARSAFLQHQDSPRTRLLEAWYEHGLSGLLEELTSGRQAPTNRALLALMGLLRKSLWIVRIAGSLHSSMFPHLAMSNDGMIERFSSNPNWADSKVRCMAWHPHAPKFAVALHDDTVSVHHAQPADIVPVLKHKMQKGVADLAWKPMSASLLAVACQSCIVLWTVDPQSFATRPSASCAQVLSSSGHCPVVSLAWSPVEDVLASASPSDNAIMLWGMTTDTCLPIRRVGRGGVTLLRWSPDGSKLFTACPTSVLRVWQCVDWSSDKWTQLLGRCQAACWSPDGSALLFTTADEPLVYRLMFNSTSVTQTLNVATVGVSEAAVPVIDLEPIARQLSDGSTVRIGGIVQMMAWDQNGERLAIVCQVPSTTFIAVFHTRLHPTFELLPCGFVRGLPDETACAISFKPKFDDGSLLSVVWSSGRIQHVPLYYVPRSRISQSHDVAFQPQQLLKTMPFTVTG